MEPLNSPLEVGIRTLTLLNEAFPDGLDISRLVQLDHALLHTGDLGGPESLLPDLPGRPGEIAIKRQLIEDGLQVIIRAELARIVLKPNGLQYVATDKADAFVNLLESDFAKRLRRRAAWIFDNLETHDDQRLRDEVKKIFERWSEEFDQAGIRNSESEGNEYE